MHTHAHTHAHTRTHTRTHTHTTRRPCTQALPYLCEEDLREIGVVRTHERPASALA